MRTDPELLEAWRGGDQSAGEELFERYYSPVTRFFANKISSDPTDLVQETFMACVRSKDKVRDVDSFRSYLFGIAYNLLRHHYRDRHVDSDRVDFETRTAADLSPGAGTMMADHAEQRLLLEALRGIPVESQVVLELFYWENMTSAAIADALDVPHATIRTRIRRARKRLEDMLTRLSQSNEILRRTLSDLDGWAAKVRATAVAKPRR